MYNIRIKKAPGGMGLAMGDQSGFGLYVAGPENDFLPKAPWGMIVNNGVPAAAEPGMSAHQRKDLRLKEDFNRHDPSWLQQYGYEGSNKGVAQALGDAGYRGDVGDVKAVQKFLIEKNLQRGNTDLFQDLVKTYGMTKRGIKEGYNPNTVEFGYDPEMNSAGWVKDLLQKVYADGKFGVRTGKMLEALMRKPGSDQVAAPNVGGDELSTHQVQDLHLQPGFNQFDPSWLKDYGYDANRKGLTNALLDAGYKGDLRNVKDIQQYLILKNLENENTGLFQDLVKNYGMTKQGIREGYKPDMVEFGYDPEMNSAGWVKDLLQKVYADGLFGRRSGEMLKALLPQPGRRMQLGGGVSSMPDEDERLQQHLQPVDRSEANIEAEKGETVWGDFDRDGMGEHLKIGGRPHSQGGTPLSVPDGSFIFSNTKRLKIGGPVLQEFGKSADGKKKFTPAELAKQYDVNKYKAMLKVGGDLDKIERDTAQMMLDNYQQKLGKLAFLQEGMKGFPQGIPGIAMPFLQHSGLLAEGNGSFPQAPPGELEKAQWGKWYGMPFAAGSAAAVGSHSDPVPVSVATRPDDPETRLLYDGLDFEHNTYGRAVYPKYLGTNRESNVPLIQHKRADGTYGTQDWDMVDFYKRHPWVEEMRPGFNKGNEADVQWFQNEYNNRYRDIFGFNYFNGKGHRKIDSHFGQGTYSTPSVVAEAPAPIKHETEHTDVGDKKEEGKKDEGKKEVTPLDWRNSETPRMPWWSQDMINLGSAFRNRYGIHKYMPTYVAPEPVLPNAVYYDPTRALASNQEAAAQQNMMNNVYAGAQRWRAVGSQIQGQGAGNSANILGDYDNRNVGTANQLAQIRAQIQNTFSPQKAIALDTYLSRNTVANQQYDNALRVADNDIRTNILSGMTNAQKTYWLNRLNPQYAIDPRSGRLDFKSGKGVHDNAGGNSGVSPLDVYKSYLSKYNEMFPDQANSDRAYSFAEKMAMGNKSRFGVDSDGDAQMSMSGIGANPYAQALLNAYTPQYGQ